MAATDQDVKTARERNRELRAQLHELQQAQQTAARGSENDVRVARLDRESEEMQRQIEALRAAASAPAPDAPVVPQGTPAEPVLVTVPDGDPNAPAAQVAVEGADLGRTEPVSVAEMQRLAAAEQTEVVVVDDEPETTNRSARKGR